jgi:hypothetical protein
LLFRFGLHKKPRQWDDQLKLEQYIPITYTPLNVGTKLKDNNSPSWLVQRFAVLLGDIALKTLIGIQRASSERRKIIIPKQGFLTIKLDSLGEFGVLKNSCLLRLVEFLAPNGPLNT